MVNIAVLGYGTVGSGVVEVLNTNRELIDLRAGEEIRVKYVLDLRDFPGDPIQEKVVHDFDTILNDPEVSIVVEVMGGLKPAYDFTKAALLKGKSVCSSNKELVASHGVEFLEIAKEKQVNYLFEASCGGGIPIIRALNESLTPEDVIEVSGILNGTTNFILTEMRDKGADFEDVLKEAQDLGYAERNPEADVEGHDACRKVAILSSIAFGKTVKYQDIYTEGISHITLQDMEYAKELNMAIKLLANGYSLPEGGDVSYYAMVAPFLVRHDHPLYSVDGVFNAIFVRGNTLGDTMFYGSGAGSLPTASAVVGDVISAARNAGKTLPCFWKGEKLTLSSNDKAVRQFFIRVGEDRAEEAKNIFRAERLVRSERVTGEVGLITGMLSEKEFADKAESFGGVLQRIRINQ
ncbi:MAG: homoserine dehydrogenase [Lachnospiraceae bacterium]|nr:homoserine dehydrogenase [Lachnospiraceae bacterium]